MGSRPTFPPVLSLSPGAHALGTAVIRLEPTSERPLPGSHYSSEFTRSVHGPAGHLKPNRGGGARPQGAAPPVRRAGRSEGNRWCHSNSPGPAPPPPQRHGPLLQSGPPGPGSRPLRPSRRPRAESQAGEGGQDPTSASTPDGCAGPPPPIQPGAEPGNNRRGDVEPPVSPPLLLRASPILTSSPLSMLGRLGTPDSGRPQAPPWAPGLGVRLGRRCRARRPTHFAFPAARGKMAVPARLAGSALGAQTSRPTPQSAPGVCGSCLQPPDTPVDPVSGRMHGGLTARSGALERCVRHLGRLGHAPQPCILIDIYI